MKAIHIAQTLCASFIFSLVVTGCEYKDIQDVDTSTRIARVRVKYDWGNVDSIPKSMRVVFYPENKTNMLLGYTCFDISNENAYVDLLPGAYSVVAWNNDCEHNIIEDFTIRDSAYATTGPYSAHGNVQIPNVLDSIYHGQRVLDYPDYMVHANIDRFSVQDRVNNQVMTLTPDSMVITVDVKLTGLKGLEHCRAIRGAINNVAEKRYISYPNKTEGNVAMMFDAYPNLTDSCVNAQFCLFDTEQPNPDDEEHKMVFFFWITGNQIFVPVDVTNAIQKARALNTKYMELEVPVNDIDLKDYIILGGSGIIVDAEDWMETKEITINL